jgi:hypothetical protein
MRLLPVDLFSGALFSAAFRFLVLVYPAWFRAFSVRYCPIQDGQNAVELQKYFRLRCKLARNSFRAGRSNFQNLKHFHKSGLTWRYSINRRFLLTAIVQPHWPGMTSANYALSDVHKRAIVQLHPVVRIVTVRPAPFSGDALPMGTSAAGIQRLGELNGKDSLLAASLLFPFGVARVSRLIGKFDSTA